VLEVQRKVVIEEFKQRYLNQPYGDVWLKLRPLAYKVHPYTWATIGKEISHIENATMDDVKDFFFQHYVPNNAIMVVAGKVTLAQVKKLSKKWFAPIPQGKKRERQLPVEPKQTEKRTLSIEAKVPANALYKSYHMAGRFHKDYYASDLMSDVLSRGQSSRLYQTLVKEKEIFTSISSFVMGTLDPGMLVISGRINEGITFDKAEAALEEVLTKFKQEGVLDSELEKVKNQSLATMEFDQVEVINRAMNLAFASLSGDAELVNKEADLIKNISVSDINRMANEILVETNASVMYYSKASMPQASNKVN
jgi:zinc protease